MTSIVNILQSYSNTCQSYDAVSSTQNNNQSRVDAIKNLDMTVISQVGPTDSTVMSLSQSDKKKVIENADNGLKKRCIDAWQGSLDDKIKKEFAKDFSVFGTV